ncbi:MAG: RHS repeat-associated core domain-containing protein, partial [Candidatus Korobacteraceae bacterium]
MAPPDFARRINYARETLYFFLNGRYSRISSNANNQLTNWIYDGGGNILNTPGGPYDNRFNLENQWTNQNTFHVTYLYDGDGQRVMASGGASGTRIFWYDEAGKVIEEEDGSNVNEYLYVGDQRIARIYNLFSPYYYYSDYLGTSRVSADENGNKCYDADYFPWGDEQQVYVNTCPQNYKFNGKERDPDMGVYDFGARFFQDGIARFYSPDWSATVEPVPYAKLNNPQSLNLYTYVLDNPLSFRDADGHEVGADTLQELQKITSDSGNAA